ncbi:hypothetical protein [Kiloniella sp.]|uniref:hypothetical protein n=1 Tax=Kiloniella sp. TaxID=1938587 RepID=UPI003A91E3AA
MRKRFLIGELADYINNSRVGSDREEVFKFLRHWIYGNPKIFISDARYLETDFTEERYLDQGAKTSSLEKYNKTQWFLRMGRPDMFITEEYAWDTDPSDYKVEGPSIDSPITGWFFLLYLNKYTWANLKIPNLIEQTKIYSFVVKKFLRKSKLMI